jgi:3-phenylpropionate/trans-cinnamate dioxygenase ferredoxin subunit
VSEHLVGTVSDFREDNMLPVAVGSMNIVLFKNPDGSIVALEDRCSHADVKLSRGTFEDGEVECSAHGARFDCRTGSALCMPAIAPVRSFAVNVVENKIFVVIDNK